MYGCWYYFLITSVKVLLSNYILLPSKISSFERVRELVELPNLLTVNDSNDVRKTQIRSTAMYTIYMVQKLSTWYLVYFNLKCEASTANTVGTANKTHSSKFTGHVILVLSSTIY